MDETAMSKHSGEEILDMFTVLAAYITATNTDDIGIAVVKHGIYTAYIPANSLTTSTTGKRLTKNVGDPVQGKASLECLVTGKRIIRIVNREQSTYGKPYVACAVPIINADEVVGCITTTKSIDIQEKWIWW